MALFCIVVDTSPTEAAAPKSGIAPKDGMAPRMLPDLTPANRPFWTGGASGQLLIQRCEPCARWVHPPVDRCPQCTGELTAQPVSGEATVFASTVAVHAYHPEVPTPYVLALVELPEQADLRVASNIVNCDPDDVAIGMAVRVVFEDRGEVFVPLFEPASE
jgi:uncharacterized protein